MKFIKITGIALGFLCGTLSLLKFIPEGEYIHAMLVAIFLVTIGNEAEEF